MTETISIEGLSDRVDSELRTVVTSRDMPLYEMMAYHMGWSDSSGKANSLPAKERTRGILCLLACLACGGDSASALPASAAVELVCNFCEIHDDVQDGSPQRDGRDAVWWIWGPAQAINAGDGMHALARLSMFRLLERGISPPTTFRALQMLDEASLLTCEGRFLDLEAQERIDLSLDAYVEMAEAKAGRLMGCAMRLGGLTAGAEEASLEALERSGRKLGVALQMRGDVAALWGDDSGDSAATPELLNKKKLLPVVLALENANISQKRQLGEIYFKRVLEPQDVVALREALGAMGIEDECRELVESSGQGALDDLKAVCSDAKSTEGLAGFVERLLRG